ncbi:MAG TPA: dihydroorotate dehydrogenase [Thermoanaerobacterales bacterium]|uniref:dihydroorotate dehydrogenase n=1 Tax=Tepidanaerobacter sp. GT38 TaxID=2722793 RepID=UPI001805BE27|nr:dihydroorotate dehydrogenase [Tepidanaerobacter sp. GT38]MCG1011390.1 dihydroorotate dehydrogenase [Tepidanaerobacter sp. GT38]HHY42726.1 dihydroorotate dehydrogenase [Thermoanaerobacterales bacterium]
MTDNTDLTVNIAGIKMQNPVMVASGTFGFGNEYKNFYDINKLGALVTKGLTLMPKAGNPPPRIHETPAGVLNSVGLENPGVEQFIAKEWPCLSKLKIPVIANISGDTVEDYYKIAKQLSTLENLAALEVNISCPNVEKGGLAFGQEPESASEVIKAVREATRLPIIAKLSPNVSHIQKIAEAVVSAGADAISLINTLLGMAIDIHSMGPVFCRKFAGLSGPAVKPVALRMVWEVYEAVSVPIIGMGGITTWQDAVEFILAGATAVAVGTANFVNPIAPIEIIEGLKTYLYLKETNLHDLIGAAH